MSAQTQQATDWVLVAVVTLHDQNPLYVDVESGWDALKDELTECNWEPPSFDSGVTVDPASWAPQFTIRFVVMLRAELDAMPEHQGW